MGSPSASEEGEFSVLSWWVTNAQNCRVGGEEWASHSMGVAPEGWGHTALHRCVQSLPGVSPAHRTAQQGVSQALCVGGFCVAGLHSHVIHMKPLKNYLTKMIQLGIPWPCDTECFSFAYAYNAIKHLNGRMLNL